MPETAEAPAGRLLSECRNKLEEVSWLLWRFQDLACSCAVYSTPVPRRKPGTCGLGGMNVLTPGGIYFWIEISERRKKRKSPHFPYELVDHRVPNATLPNGIGHPDMRALLSLALRHWRRCEHRITLDVERHQHGAVARDSEPRLREEWHDWRHIRPGQEETGRTGEGLERWELLRWSEPGPQGPLGGDAGRGCGRWPGGARAPLPRIPDAEWLCG